MGSRSNDSQSVGVVGVGDIGKATLVDLGLRGHIVSAYNRSPERVQALAREKHMTARGVLSGSCAVHAVCPSIEQLCNDVSVVFLTTPATAHQELAALMAPHLHDRHIVVLSPGRTLGVIEFLQLLRAHGCTAPVTVVETNTTMYVARSMGPTTINIFALKEGVRMAALPSPNRQRAFEVLRTLYPHLIEADSVLETSLLNFGAILHPLPTLLNAGRIETTIDEFPYYHEAITGSIARACERLDAERLAIAKAYGVRTYSVSEYLRVTYGSAGTTFHERLRNTRAFTTVAAPTTLSHRYVEEDISTGLLPMTQLAAKTGLATPLMDATVEMGSALTNIPFREAGRTLKRLGWHDFSSDQIARIVN